MQITKDLVSYCAALSRIKLEESEVESMQEQMNSIVNYMDVLNKLDTDGVEPLSHVFNITNVMREDEVASSFDRAEILKNGPDHADDSFVVPKTVE